MHAWTREVILSGVAAQTHFRSFQVCPELPRADMLAMLLRRSLMSESWIGGRGHWGCGGGSSVRQSRTSGGESTKK